VKLIIIIGLFLTIVSFQNCSQVGLEDTASKVTPLYASGKILLCLPENYTLENIIVRNLNLVQSNEGLELDSDSDGLSDTLESQFGLNPLNRSSYGNIMDKLCLDLTKNGDCTANNFTQNCTDLKSPLGLSNCELEALSVEPSAFNAQGIDSDNDGIIDLLEIFSASEINEPDATSDPDHDLVSNLKEVMRNSHPKQFDNAFDDSRFNNVTSTEIKSDELVYLESGCTQELKDVKIISLPFAQHLKEFKDLDEPNQSSQILSFSRPENSSIILIVLKITSKLGYNLPSKFYYKSVLVSENQARIELNMDDLFLAGEEL